MIRVGVVGASGFMGGELVRLLLGHPHVQLTSVAGGSSAGKRLASIRAGFAGVSELLIDPAEPDLLAGKCDLVFLALPHGESAVLAAQLLNRDVKVIDLGSDFRLKNPADVEQYYGRPAVHTELLDQAFYSLPELTGVIPERTRLLASPGCFATGLNLVLALCDGLVESVDLFGITGSTGSGIAPSAGVHHSLRSTNFVAYKALNHQHEGEVRQLLSERRAEIDFRFVPHSAPLTRGIHLTTVVRAPASELKARWETLYGGKPMLIRYDAPVALGSVVGTNLVAMGMVEQGDSTAITCAFDNLLKGGSGQAIQSMNLWLGFPETAGLPMIAAWP